ncbi:MAG: sigma-54 dependent transcriptional regulator [Deferrisomatales bacterium]|nr:sigma-54 dependent transcriptional regulator [Deferrisomatales bacterium]
MQTSILVVEGDGYTADHLSRYFRENGYAVHHEDTGRAGLASLKTLRPDVAFIDLYLPDMDGRTLLAEASTAGLETRVLMVSGRKNLSAVVECMRLGALDFLEKPFNPEEFWLSLRRAEDRLSLEREVRRLRLEVQRGSPYQLLFGRSRRMRDVQAIVDQIADTDITVLLRGESGTGKDLFARTIWECSRRRNGRFVKVNCAALPRDLLESELFGYEQGAFTGAHRTKQGRFEYANGGTVFLDEITEMHVDLQAKLLHVLQDAEFCRVGGKEPVPVDVRIIAASNRTIEDEIREKRFRSDLFYRLNVVSIHIPPLRERAEEIPHLVEHFLHKYREQYRRPDAQVPEDLLRGLQNHHWPGNIRELENYMKRLVVAGDADGVRRELRLVQRRTAAEARAAEAPADMSDYEGMTLKDVAKEAARQAEREVLAVVLEKTRWNRRRASSLLDISYKALLYKIREAGLE